ncbi:MAG: class I SAM-dependent methyltransferase [Acidobacteriota bacterium]
MSAQSHESLLVLSWELLFLERHLETVLGAVRGRGAGARVGFTSAKEAGLSWVSGEILERIEANSVAVAELGGVAELRRVWIERAKIGHWDSEWREVGLRSTEYFSDYEMNIRCWIPGYEHLIDMCAAAVETELLTLLVAHGGMPRVLEVGFGTGALSAKLVHWIGQVNTPFSLLGRPFPIGRFIGVDAAPQMLSRIEETTIGGPYSEAEFLHGKAFDEISEEVRMGAPFGVICGSLVLHDILGEEASKTFGRFLEAAKSLLTDEGTLVFADCFADSRPGIQDRQVRSWLESMLGIGLSQSVVEHFLSCNPEMVNPVSRQRVSEVAARFGFQPPEFRVWEEESGAQSQEYFSVMILRRSGS